MNISARVFATFFLAAWCAAFACALCMLVFYLIGWVNPLSEAPMPEDRQLVFNLTHLAVAGITLAIAGRLFWVSTGSQRGAGRGSAC